MTLEEKQHSTQKYGHTGRPRRYPKVHIYAWDTVTHTQMCIHTYTCKCKHMPRPRNILRNIPDAQRLEGQIEGVSASPDP